MTVTPFHNWVERARAVRIEDEIARRGIRLTGKVERSFSLPHDINETAVTAKYDDGVLKLSLPLREQRAGKTIKVG